jgi:AcrR family transcriptional regulator
MAEGREDFRITKTKFALVDAFTALISEKKFESITVNELCDRADIRRATFYKHFDDKYDFLSFVVKTYREKFDKKIWKKEAPDATKEYYVKYADTLLSFFESEPEIVNSILSSSASHIIINSMIEQNYHDTVIRLNKSVEEGMNLRASIPTTAAMLTGGISMILVRRLTSEEKISREEIIEEISSMIDGVLYARDL